MGCGSSAAGSAEAAKATGSSLEARPSSAPISGVESMKRSITSAIKRPFSGKKPSSADSRFRLGQKQASLDQGAGADLRQSSATSERSVDSGIGGDAILKSSLDGTSPLAAAIGKAPIVNSDTRPEKPLADEQTVLESLRSEGLLGPKTNTSKGGLTFEVPLGELKVPSRRPPPRLQKLDRNLQLNLTRDQIRDKLANAEKIRKKREADKLKRNRDKEAKNLDVKLALLKIDKAKETGISKTTNSKDSIENLQPNDNVATTVKTDEGFTTVKTDAAM